MDKTSTYTRESNIRKLCTGYNRIFFHPRRNKIVSRAKNVQFRPTVHLKIRRLVHERKKYIKINNKAQLYELQIFETVKFYLSNSRFKETCHGTNTASQIHVLRKSSVLGKQVNTRKFTAKRINSQKIQNNNFLSILNVTKTFQK